MDLMRQQIRSEEQEVFRSIREDVSCHPPLYPQRPHGTWRVAASILMHPDEGAGDQSLGETPQKRQRS